MEGRILCTKDLTKEYRSVTANDKVSVTINKGDIYGFIGANGAGKTTFMRMVCGLTEPTFGSIELLGETKSRNFDIARTKMGVLIEHPAYYPGMTALQNLEVQKRYLDVAGKNRISKKRLEELLELVGLDDVKGKKVKDFSMGMKQRLGLALALIGNPEFVILDEPYVGLDPIGVVEIRKLLSKLNKENGLTILFSSHNLSEVTQLATRYGFLSNGKLVRELSAEELDNECKEQNKNLEDYFINLMSKYRRESK